jgi:hypothetical protein
LSFTQASRNIPFVLCVVLKTTRRKRAMKLPLLVAGSVAVLMATSALAQTMPNATGGMPAGNGTTMPNANQTPEAPATGTLPTTNGTGVTGSGTTTTTPGANPMPSTNPLCAAGQVTTNCAPPPNPNNCLPGQTSPTTGTACPPNTVP